MDLEKDLYEIEVNEFEDDETGPVVLVNSYDSNSKLVESIAFFIVFDDFGFGENHMIYNDERNGTFDIISFGSTTYLEYSAIKDYNFIISFEDFNKEKLPVNHYSISIFVSTEESDEDDIYSLLREIESGELTELSYSDVITELFFDISSDDD